MDWVIHDMNGELNSWGYAGVSDDRLVLQSDGEEALVVVVVRDAADSSETTVYNLREAFQSKLLTKCHKRQKQLCTNSKGLHVYKAIYM